ncbi:hypothetical protein Hdeb2414_s0015g00443291 [Helianthus debilis subsp. tardiflorus]
MDVLISNQSFLLLVLAKLSLVSFCICQSFFNFCSIAFECYKSLQISYGFSFECYKSLQIPYGFCLFIGSK